MNSKEYSIIIDKTARYYTNIPDLKNINSVLFVIHGYAQLAKDFINDFDFLSDENTLIIAPEGLSKFYFRNNVASSWMTKEDRENEIADYIIYLDLVFKEVNDNFNLESANVNLLGFSQGVHTAARWFIKSENHFDKLILCSSDFPRDADFNLLRSKLEVTKIYFLYGDNDHLVYGKTFEDSVKLLKTENINFEEIIFEGKHEINEDSVIQILLPPSHKDIKK